jgi:cytidylate kinase
LARGERTTFSAVRGAMAERDRRDTERDLAPLAPAPDAVVVLTDDCDEDEVVAHLRRLAARWPAAPTRGGNAPCGRPLPGG